MKLNTLVTVIPLSQRSHSILTVLTGTQTGRVIELKPGDPYILGRNEGCQLRFDDASVSGQHAKIIGLVGGFHFVDDNSTNGSAVNAVRVAPGTMVTLKDGDRIQLGSGTLLRFSLVDDTEVQALKGMYDAAFRDALTGAYNRKHLEERLEAELAFALRHSTDLSVLMLDVDHFKRVNDTHGHLAGDAILKTTAQVLQRQLRAEDLLARYGGEEFVVVARGITVPHTLVLGERLRSGIASAVTDFAGTELKVTISVGFATLRDCGEKRDKASLVAAADGRLYRAKEGGRNRVVGP
jgi:diguanylate cyclase (GGDEF)-like protein